MTEQSIFLAALDIDEPRARGVYLDRACAGDPGLREQVERLLEAHGKDGSFLERPAPGLAATMDRPGSGERVAERPGTVIGPYRLMEQIGEGGFGLVFVAEQQQPVRRKVALKVIKPGMDTREVIARFEAERQALALMDHPNIARVLDAGTTASGRPYFVMELVKGVPITDYCDQAQLTPRQRLELFVPVCQAVQHAHQKGVIHRDIKPSNVLVTLHDGTPVVKVIDFGVAKAIGQHLTEKTIYTRFAQMIGTPLYISPEQAEMSGLDVDTRSDIYSLGVLLYELLTGSTPFDRQRFGMAAFDEIRRIIREEDPPKPSTRLTSLGRTLPAVSAKRGTEPRKLSALVRGDLDWIVMKAMEKDRGRRYETASALAADVRRFLTEEPVEARPPSAWYRFGKLARRNRAALTTATLVAAALVLGTALATWQAVRATHSAARATEQEALAQSALGEKERARAEAVEARKKAEDFAERLKQATALVGPASALAYEGRWSAAQATFARAEQLQPEFIGTYIFREGMYARLGLWDLAAADGLKAFTLGGGAGAYGSDWHDYALLQFAVGDPEHYKHYEQACRQMLERLNDSSDTLAALSTARTCALAPQPVVDPVELARRARQANATNRAAWRLYIEGLADYRAGAYQQAVACAEESLDTGADWPAKPMFYPVQAMAYHRLGRDDLARRALASADQAMDSWSEGRFRMPLGSMPVPWYDWLEFSLLYREATVLLTGAPPPDDPRLKAVHARALAALTDNGAAPFLERGRALAARGEWAAAAKEFAGALDRSDDSLSAYSTLAGDCFEVAERPALFDELVRLRPDAAPAWVAHGRSLAKTKQWKQALADYARVMDSCPPDDNAMLEYASLRLLADDQAGYRRLCARLAERYGHSSDPYTAHFLSRTCTLAPGAAIDPARSIAWARAWRSGPPARPELPWTTHALGAAYCRAGQFDDAIRCFRESQRLDPQWVGQCMNDAFLAVAYARSGQADPARECLGKADRWLADADREVAGQKAGFPRNVYPSDWLIVQAVRKEAAQLLAAAAPSATPAATSQPAVPETWDEDRLASLEAPLADPAASPKHVSKEYYSSIPLRPIYKSYDVYRPDLEPKDYWEWLSKQEPEVIWDENKSPPLETEADWIKAGEIVFDSPTGWGNASLAGPYEGLQVRDPAWYEYTESPLTADGKLPFYRYVIRTKGRVEVGVVSCAMCHTRVMPDKTVVKGAQGNFPFGRAAAYDARKCNSTDLARQLHVMLFGAPWLRPDPLADLERASAEDLASAFEVVPAGVLTRHGTGNWSPVQVPDLIGIRQRKYLDRTGMVRHRDVGDLMRYAALNQGADFLSLHGHFRPISGLNKEFNDKLPPPAPAGEVPGGRYSDVQLFALAKYLYALKPPENPNLPKTDAERERVARGEKLFSESGCAKCHDPGQGYTNNKLVRAPGFTVPADHPEKANILARSVGTDPTLALRTRRGTGLYKVPSLQGLWYRGPFEHNGSVATLEDWFDPKRLEEGYVPTGWKGPPGTKTRAVAGHEFGLDLSAEDREALIAFLKTL